MAEFERIARLTARFTRGTRAPHVLVGIGDDAAIVDLGGPAVLSTDASIEGVHFRRSFAPLDVLARRAVHAAASDLAAMGAHPSALLISLGIPSDVGDAEFDALIEGFARASSELGMPIVGGNLSTASELGITTTVIGRDVDCQLLRSGAMVGDSVYLTGPVGGAALGLAALLDGRTDPTDPFVRAWTSPVARFDASSRMRGLASSAIDVSDGLSADLAHVLEASHVGATIDLDAIPVFADFHERCASEGRSSDALLLGGGEDYELIFTAARADLDGGLATRIGRIDAELGLRTTRSGRTTSISPRGHEHR